MWLNAINKKPKINVLDNYDKDHQISERVIVWLEDHENASFGHYNHLIKSWSVEGYMGFKQDRIKWFMYLSNPYKK